MMMTSELDVVKPTMMTLELDLKFKLNKINNHDFRVKDAKHGLITSFFLYHRNNLPTHFPFFQGKPVRSPIGSIFRNSARPFISRKRVRVIFHAWFARARQGE